MWNQVNSVKRFTEEKLYSPEFLLARPLERFDCVEQGSTEAVNVLLHKRKIRKLLNC